MPLSPTTCRRLDIQGFQYVDTRELSTIARWLRLAFGLCAALAFVGTTLASPTLLLILLPIAAAAAAFPVHPFDLIYNYGIRHLTRTGPLPKRGAPNRFACGLASVWLIFTAWAFSTGHTTLGYVLGFTMTAIATLVSTTDICIPSMIYRLIFGWPSRRTFESPRK